MARILKVTKRQRTSKKNMYDGPVEVRVNMSSKRPIVEFIMQKENSQEKYLACFEFEEYYPLLEALGAKGVVTLNKKS